MFKCRYKGVSDSEWETGELKLNTHAIAEVLTGDDSVFFSDLEVNINETGWQLLHDAIRSKLLLEDNYSTFLAEPKNDEERERDWI